MATSKTSTKKKTVKRATKKTVTKRKTAKKGKAPVIGTFSSAVAYLLEQTDYERMRVVQLGGRQVSSLSCRPHRLHVSCKCCLQ